MLPHDWSTRGIHGYHLTICVLLLRLTWNNAWNCPTPNALQGWFPWFASSEHKQIIAKFRAARDQVGSEVSEAEHALLLAQRDANKQLGLFSSHGKEIAKERLWCGGCARLPASQCKFYYS